VLMQVCTAVVLMQVCTAVVLMQVCTAICMLRKPCAFVAPTLGQSKVHVLQHSVEQLGSVAQVCE
jgi:hypothetical protein